MHSWKLENAIQIFLKPKLKVWLTKEFKKKLVWQMHALPWLAGASLFATWPWRSVDNIIGILFCKIINLGASTQLAYRSH